MKIESLEQARDFFKNDLFATINGAVIDEIGEDYAKCSLAIEEKHLNAVGAVMGGVYFTLADFCFAVASNLEEQGTVSLNASITYLGSAKGKKLFAKANCIKNGRNTNYFQIDISDDLDNHVAVVNITGFHKR